MFSLPRVILLVFTALLAAACSEESRTGFSRAPASVIEVEDEDEEALTTDSSGKAAGSSTRTDAGTTYVPQPVQYKSFNWVRGDGSTPQGGIPPAKEREPKAIPSNFDTASWMSTNSNPSPPNGEAKFRTHCNYSHLAYDDPIVFPGKPGVSHLHMYFGNTLTNAYSTYESLRTTGGSTCGGGPLNRSAYWFPAVLKDNATGDGKAKVIKPDFAIVYYNVWEDRHEAATRLFRGLSYVFGFNPSDPNNEFERAEIATARAEGYAKEPKGFHSYNFVTNGFMGWKCEMTNGANSYSPKPGSYLQPYLRTPDGHATLTCPANERIAAALRGPACWDGYNLSSPDGRKHFRQYASESNSGRTDLCPEGWYEVPNFDLVIWFSHTGPDDYKEWYLSSDRMPGMTQFLNGQSMHTDWFGAWDYRVMKTWMVYCNGITIRARAGVPHSCSGTQFGDGTQGFVGNPAPDASRNPQVELGVRWAARGDERFLDLPDVVAGAQGHMHHPAPPPQPTEVFNNQPDEIPD